jgi:hypothetical protein
MSILKQNRVALVTSSASLSNGERMLRTISLNKRVEAMLYCGTKPLQKRWEMHLVLRVKG